MTGKVNKKDVKKSKKLSFWVKSIPTVVGLAILLAELAIFIGIGILICL